VAKVDREQYNQSLAQLGYARPQNYIQLYLPVTFLLPHHWSVTPRYEVKADLAKNDLLIQSIRLQIAKQLDRLPITLSLYVKKPFHNGPLDNGQKEFQVNFMITYYMR